MAVCGDVRAGAVWLGSGWVAGVGEVVGEVVGDVTGALAGESDGWAGAESVDTVPFVTFGGAAPRSILVAGLGSSPSLSPVESDWATTWVLNTRLAINNRPGLMRAKLSKITDVWP